MLQKFVTVLIVLSLLPVLLIAQEKSILKPNGEIYKFNDYKDRDVIHPSKGYKSLNKNQIMRLNPPVNPLSELSLVDTLWIPPTGGQPPYNQWFGYSGQDWLVVWFEAPADLNLLQVGFVCSNDTLPGGTTQEVKVVKLNWTKDYLLSFSDAAGPIGYYEADGNGYNNVSAFMNNPDVTGGWVMDPNWTGQDQPFGEDIWSDNGVGYAFIPYITDSDSISNGSLGTYNWVDMSLLQVPQISAGTIFGVAIQNKYPLMDDPYVGFPYATDNVPIFKFYANGRLVPGVDYGWWLRTGYTITYAAIVEITGNTPPDINSFTTIPSDVNLGPFTVDANISDENPGNPDSAGVASAMIQWSIDGGQSWNDVAMTGTEPDFTGQIPAQPGNTMVTYRISATDITNKTSTSLPVDFYVFQPSGANTLVIFNGFDDLTVFPADSYWPSNVSFEYDSWNYGEATSGLLNNYDNVIEIWNENFGVYNDSTIRLWIEGAGNRNYLLAGQEYLGAWNGYNDTSFVSGDFIYDILGIDSSFNDITYIDPLNNNNSIGDSLATWVKPQAGTLFGQPLVDVLASVPDADSLMFNPLGVYQTPDNLNWQDGFHALADVAVDMMVETRGMGDDRTNPIVRTIPTLAHRTLPAGNKIVFHAYDPVSLTTANDDSYPYWYWVGPDSANSVFQALRWFEIVLGVNGNGGAIPTQFALEQNYPNPFNPATTIKFSIPEVSKVTLKIYDILGREVSTLVNEVRNAGNHEVNFDASNLASGMYIYSIKAGDYTASKKMMLLK